MAVDDIRHIFQFNSHILENYFEELNLKYVIKYFRRALLLLILVNVYLLCKSSSKAMQVPTIHFFTCVIFSLISIVIYIWTFREKRFKVYAYVSDLVTLIQLAITPFQGETGVFMTSNRRFPLIETRIVIISLQPYFLIVLFTILFLTFVFLVTFGYLYFVDELSSEGYRHTPFWNHVLSESLPSLIKPKYYGRNKLRPYIEVFKLMNVWICLFFIALYIRFWNTLKRRTAFLRVGQCLQAESMCKQAMITQRRWINTVMPSAVSNEYILMRQQNIGNGNNSWLYTKAYDNVSILFADIVGFTKLSSTETASNIVKMLNDLYSRFDLICDLTNCEKVGTLGDCYYSVCGCSVPRSNHASCSIEMGLAICRSLKRFNREYNKQLGIRVGIHSGRVNAAIIGNKRFRYDIYSLDVLIANALESTGISGRVHISETTYEQVQQIYNVAKGEILELKQERFTQGRVQKIVLDTYFVDPRSAILYRKDENFGGKPSKMQPRKSVDLKNEESRRSRASSIRSSLSDLTLMTSRRSRLRSSGRLSRLSSLKPVEDTESRSRGIWNNDGYESTYTLDKSYENIVFGAQGTKEKFLIHRAVQSFVTQQRSNPDEKIRQFLNPPISRFLMHFDNPEYEKLYRQATTNINLDLNLDSLAYGPAIDGIACTVVILICLFESILISMGHERLVTPNIVISLIEGVFVISFMVLTLWSIQFPNQSEKRPLAIRIHRFITHYVIKEFLFLILTLLPTFHTITLVYISHQLQLDHRNTYVMYSYLQRIAVWIHIVPLSSIFLMRIMGIILSVLGLAVVYPFTEIPQSVNCLSMIKHGKIPTYWENALDIDFLAVVINFILICTVTRQNEYNCRLNFFITHTALHLQQQMEYNRLEGQELLYNIIPEYVFKRLVSTDGQINSNSINYARNFTNIGVVFACITNFFSTYYQEDYKGGEAALKLLNMIICSFDDLLDKPMFKDVEKIKTIMDCYMVASGLNKEHIDRGSFMRRSHLIALMDYCFLLFETLNEFNAQYVIGNQKFLMKIGYNFGDVTAGIIGQKKPMYDIWGDTVNVASRMYSTGLVGQIQCPEYVQNVLKDHYDFVPRDQVFVKGKGILQTCICKLKNYA